MKKLENKTAFVTGGSQGIGAAIAKEFGAAGATVIINYSTNKAAANGVVAAITSAGGRAEAIQGDFSNPEDIARVYTEISKTHEKLDILVNNAGVARFGPLEAATPEDFYHQYNLNVLGLVISTKEALSLLGTDGSSVINIGSAVGRLSPAYASMYSGSKGAVNSITVSLSKELGPRKIRVNALNPGLIETDGTIASGATTNDLAKIIQKMTPLGGFGMPKDVATIAVFLASDDSSWISGQEIIAAGGFTM